MAFKVEERLLRYSLSAQSLLTQVNSRQQMVGGTFHISIGQELRLSQGAEIKDSRKVILTPQAFYIPIRGIVQMSRSQQTMRTHLFAIGSRQSA